VNVQPQLFTISIAVTIVNAHALCAGGGCSSDGSHRRFKHRNLP
jgi:hypothetical protein